MHTELSIGDEVYLCGGGHAGNAVTVLSLHRRKERIRVRLRGAHRHEFETWMGFAAPLSAVDQLARLAGGQR